MLVDSDKETVAEQLEQRPSCATPRRHGDDGLTVTAVASTS